MIEPFATLIASGTASLVVYPLDVLKSYRFRSIHNDNDIGSRKIAREIRARGGVAGFYRGAVIHCMTYPVFWTTYFCAEERLATIETRFGGAAIFMPPMLASILGSFVANPLFVIKTRMQTNLLAHSISPSIMTTARMIAKDAGVGGFWRGFPATAASSLKLAIQMPLCDMLRDAGIPTLVAAAVANTTTMVLLYPLDYIRTNQRIESGRLSAMDFITKSVRSTRPADAPKGEFYGRWAVSAIGKFYRGMGSYLAVSLPNFVIMMGLRTYLRG